MKNRLPKQKTIAALAGLLLMTTILCGPALSHRVNIFAWVEGDTVYTESKFSSGRRAMAAPIEVFDDRGNRLLEGKTDARGAFAFKVPKQSALKIVLHAGAGHQNQWTVPLAEVEAALGSVTPATPTVSKTDATGIKSPPEPASQEEIGGKKYADRETRQPFAPALSAEKIQSAVEKALDRKLKPLILRMNRLEEARNKPEWSDVLGGIGYIIGLMGIAAWMKYRKNS